MTDIDLDRPHIPCPDDVSLKQYQCIRKVVKFMHENYHDYTVRLDRVAYLADMSPAHCSRVFKKVMGQTYSQYLQSLRISRAMSMLQIDVEGIIDIAAAVGYYDLTNFCRSFKKMTGQTPSSYREEMRKKKYWEDKKNGIPVKD